MAGLTLSFSRKQPQCPVLTDSNASAGDRDIFFRFISNSSSDASLQSRNMGVASMNDGRNNIT